MSERRHYTLPCPRCGRQQLLVVTRQGEVGIDCLKCDRIYVLPRRFPTATEADYSNKRKGPRINIPKQEKNDDQANA